ncbi:MAG: DUF1214 domain-containing protein [Chloroflexi bacterium]|nr:DUF1214 domain-containing protein [Chloroflexota bacterium]MBM4453227.1 DUF1214 domain-containing protein [Chloroflexota bacterium]
MAKPIKFLIAAVVALVLGVGIGYVTASPLVDLIFVSKAVKNGPWMTNLDIGSQQAGPYLRAAIARHGLLALTKSEAVYFSAYSDSDGQPLRGSCDYAIECEDMDAEWWSITVYGKDNFLIPNPQNIYSCNGNSLVRDADGMFRIHLSATPKEVNWLPSGNEESLSLTLRLYKAGNALLNDPAAAQLPRITKVKCQ